MTSAQPKIRHIKCEYCDSTYAISNDKHADNRCPYCGAVNSFDEHIFDEPVSDTTENNEDIIAVPKSRMKDAFWIVLTVIIFMVVTFVAIFAVSAALGETDNEKAVTHEIESDLPDEIEVDYLSDNTVTGTYDEVIAMANTVDKRLWAYFECSYKCDKKFAANSKVLRFDSIKVCHYFRQYSEDSTSVDIKLSIEDKAGTENYDLNSIDWYLVSGDTRDRLQSYPVLGYDYPNGDVLSLSDAFDRNFSGTTYWDIKVCDFKDYDAIECVASDGTVIFNAPLERVQSGTKFSYFTKWKSKK